MAELFDAFHYFSQLPLEIQEMIWRLALPAIRIVYADGPVGARRPRRNARIARCPHSGHDLLPRALREDTRHWSGGYATVPALLHVCKESRYIAIESGYVLAFSDPDTSNRVWFNPQTDYMQIISWEYTDLTKRATPEDLGLVTKATTELVQFDQPGATSNCVRIFENLEEILIVMKHTYPHPEDCVIIDCINADLSDESKFWHPPGFDHHYQSWYNKQGDSHPPFYESLLRRYIDELRQEWIWHGKPGLHTPQIRLVYVTDVDGEMDLERIRQLPQLEDWKSFAEDDMDMEAVALSSSLPPSFERQYADDLEVDDHLFRESINKSLEDTACHVP